MNLMQHWHHFKNRLTHRDEIAAKREEVHQVINEQTKQILSSQINLRRQTKESRKRSDEYTKEMQTVAAKIAKAAGR